MSLDLAVLGIPIQANDQQAIAGLTRVDAFSKQTALQFSQQWRTSANAVSASFVQVESAGKRASAAAATGARMNASEYQKWGNAGIRAAGAITLMGDAATSSDKSLNNLLRTGSSIAFMFGPTGAIVGSVGIMASLVVSAVTGSISEIEKVRVKMEQTFETARYSGSFDALMSQADEVNRLLDTVRTKREAMDSPGWGARLLRGAAEGAGFGGLADKVTGWQRGRLDEEISKLERLEQQQLDAAAAAAESAARQADMDRVAAARARALADAERAQEAARREKVRQMESEAGWLAKLRDLGAITMGQIQRARELELQYNRELSAGNLTLEQSIALIERRNAALAASGGLAGRVGEGRLARGPAPNAGAGLGAAAAAVARNQVSLAAIESAGLNEVLETAGGEGARAFASGLAGGLRSAFESGGIVEGIEALGKGILASFGDLLVQLGTQGLIANELVQRLFTWLGTPAGFLAATGLIVAGTALSALGGGGGRSGGGRGRGSSSSSVGSRMEDRVTRYSVSPRSGTMAPVTERDPVQVTNYNFGVNDPVFERKLTEATERGARRGRGARA